MPKTELCTHKNESVGGELPTFAVLWVQIIASYDSKVSYVECWLPCWNEFNSGSK